MILRASTVVVQFDKEASQTRPSVAAALSGQALTAQRTLVQDDKETD